MRASFSIAFAMMIANPSSASTAESALSLKMGAAAIFSIDGGAPIAIRAAKADETPAPGEIKISLSYADGASKMLVINNTATFLNYRASITDHADRTGQLTSVCTLMSNGRIAFESWTGPPLPGIRLSDFTPAKDGEIVCR